MIADRGYAAETLLLYLQEQGIEAVIPPHQRAKVLREYDAWLYRECHLGVNGTAGQFGVTRVR